MAVHTKPASTREARAEIAKVASSPRTIVDKSKDDEAVNEFDEFEEKKDRLIKEGLMFPPNMEGKKTGTRLCPKCGYRVKGGRTNVCYLCEHQFPPAAARGSKVKPGETPSMFSEEEVTRRIKEAVANALKEEEAKRHAMLTAGVLVKELLGRFETPEDMVGTFDDFQNLIDEIGSPDAARDALVLHSGARLEDAHQADDDEE